MEFSPKPPTVRGPAETFTGEVWIDPITRGLPPSQLNVAAVRFTPGARTAWHSHEKGQTRRDDAARRAAADDLTALSEELEPTESPRYDCGSLLV